MGFGLIKSTVPFLTRRWKSSCMACRASGLDAFARVPPTDYGTIMRPMEAGCSGVMVAQIRTWMRFIRPCNGEDIRRKAREVYSLPTLKPATAQSLQPSMLSAATLSGG